MRLRERSLGALMLVACVAGCTRLQLVSSGEIGCPPEDIEISDKKVGWNSTAWNASCGDHVYQCSSLASAHAVDFACKPVMFADASEPEEKQDKTESPPEPPEDKTRLLEEELTDGMPQPTPDTSAEPEADAEEPTQASGDTEDTDTEDTDTEDTDTEDTDTEPVSDPGTSPGRDDDPEAPEGDTGTQEPDLAATPN